MNLWTVPEDNSLDRFDIWQFRFDLAIGIMFRRKYVYPPGQSRSSRGFVSTKTEYGFSLRL
jgi:hypothetical protein